MTLSIGNHVVKLNPESGAPLMGFEGELAVEYEIVDLHTAEYDAETGEEQVTARLKKVR